MDAASAPLLGEEKGYGASGKTEVPSREEEDRRAQDYTYDMDGGDAFYAGNC